jgi:hypothetical protein
MHQAQRQAQADVQACRRFAQGAGLGVQVLVEDRVLAAVEGGVEAAVESGVGRA